MKAKSLLDQAKEVSLPRKKEKYTDEEVELALAWMRGEVTLYQVRTTVMNKMSCGGSSIYTYLALAMRQHATKGKLGDNEG